MRYKSKVIEYFGCETPVVWDAWDNKVQKACDTLAEAEKDTAWFNATTKGEVRVRKNRSRVDQFLDKQQAF